MSIKIGKVQKLEEFLNSRSRIQCRETNYESGERQMLVHGAFVNCVKGLGLCLIGNGVPLWILNKKER